MTTKLRLTKLEGLAGLERVKPRGRVARAALKQKLERGTHQNPLARLSDSEVLERAAQARQRAVKSGRADLIARYDRLLAGWGVHSPDGVIRVRDEMRALEGESADRTSQRIARLRRRSAERGKTHPNAP
ncbi:MAG TPA: hypothetical protein PLC98_08015 [Anaerolineales bacterium]|nr:hypothetical protein [Anaerolineales bacterium]